MLFRSSLEVAILDSHRRPCSLFLVAVVYTTRLTMSGEGRVGRAGRMSNEMIVEERGTVNVPPAMSFMRLSTSSGDVADESALLDDDLMSSLVPPENTNCEESSPLTRAY